MIKTYHFCIVESIFFLPCRQKNKEFVEKISANGENSGFEVEARIIRNSSTS